MGVLGLHWEFLNWSLETHSDNPEFEMAAYFSSIKYNDPNTHILGQITVKISKMPYQIDQKLPKQGVNTPKFTQN